MSPVEEYLVLGIIAALIAGHAQAVHDMLRTLTAHNPKLAGSILEAIARGTAARATQGSGS